MNAPDKTATTTLKQAAKHSKPAPPSEAATAARPYDITTTDAIIRITSPSGAARTFSISTQPLFATFTPNVRTAGELLPDGSKVMFAFVDAFGVHVWHRYRGADGPSQWEKYARMLESASVYEKKGCKYEISTI